MTRRVAITGFGVVAPGGNDPDALFATLVEGRSAVCRLSGDVAGRIGAAVSLDLRPQFPAARFRMLDRCAQLAMVAARQAVAHAQLELDDDERLMAGVMFGTACGGGEQRQPNHPWTVLRALDNAPAAWIAAELGLAGPCITVNTACSASQVAIGEGFRRIRAGDAPVMIVGGADAPLRPVTMAAWEALGALAHDDGDPATACRPFSARRTGLVLAEGAAVLVLEDLERARARGASAYAELVGYGIATDTSHITVPSVDGQARAMLRALEDAALPPEAVGYINAHGTGTPANDHVETAAIRRVFGAHADRLAVSSTKSAHGHLLGAAGALELVVTILAMRRRTLPPTINLLEPDPACDLDYVPNQARHDVDVTCAASNAFGFGGTNATLIARRVEGP